MAEGDIQAQIAAVQGRLANLVYPTRNNDVVLLNTLQTNARHQEENAIEVQRAREQAANPREPYNRGSHPEDFTPEQYAAHARVEPTGGSSEQGANIKSLNEQRGLIPPMASQTGYQELKVGVETFTAPKSEAGTAFLVAKAAKYVPPDYADEERRANYLLGIGLKNDQVANYMAGFRSNAPLREIAAANGVSQPPVANPQLIGLSLPQDIIISGSSALSKASQPGLMQQVGQLLSQPAEFVESHAGNVPSFLSKAFQGAEIAIQSGIRTSGLPVIVDALKNVEKVDMRDIVSKGRFNTPNIINQAAGVSAAVGEHIEQKPIESLIDFGVNIAEFKGLGLVLGKGEQLIGRLAFIKAGEFGFGQSQAISAGLEAQETYRKALFVGGGLLAAKSVADISIMDKETFAVAFPGIAGSIVGISSPPEINTGVHISEVSPVPLREIVLSNGLPSPILSDVGVPSGLRGDAIINSLPGKPVSIDAIPIGSDLSKLRLAEFTVKGEPTPSRLTGSAELNMQAKGELFGVPFEKAPVFSKTSFDTSSVEPGGLLFKGKGVKSSEVILPDISGRGTVPTPARTMVFEQPVLVAADLGERSFAFLDVPAGADLVTFGSETGTYVKLSESEPLVNIEKLDTKITPLEPGVSVVDEIKVFSNEELFGAEAVKVVGGSIVADGENLNLVENSVIGRGSTEFINVNAPQVTETPGGLDIQLLDTTLPVKSEKLTSALGVSQEVPLVPVLGQAFLVEQGRQTAAAAGIGVYAIKAQEPGALSAPILEAVARERASRMNRIEVQKLYGEPLKPLSPKELSFLEKPKAEDKSLVAQESTLIGREGIELLKTRSSSKEASLPAFVPVEKLAPFNIESLRVPSFAVQSARPESVLNQNNVLRQDNRIEPILKNDLRTRPTIRLDILPRVDIVPKVDIRSESRVDTRSKIDTRIDTRVDMRIDSRVDNRLDTKIDTRVDTRFGGDFFRPETPSPPDELVGFPLFPTNKKKGKFRVTVGKPGNKIFAFLGEGDLDLVKQGRELTLNSAAARITVENKEGAPLDLQGILGNKFQKSKKGEYFIQKRETRISSSEEKMQIPGASRGKPALLISKNFNKARVKQKAGMSLREIRRLFR